MTEPPPDYDKQLDLHTSEWSKEGKKQPILGANAGVFFFVMIPAVLLSAAFAWLVGIVLKRLIY